MNLEMIRNRRGEWCLYDGDRLVAVCSTEAVARELARRVNAYDAMRTALEIVRDDDIQCAAELGCDAGNWDGGSTEGCEHCMLLAHAESITRLLEGTNDNETR